MDTKTSTNANSQIEIKFKTTLPSEYKVPDSSFNIPSASGPTQLNDLVKKLLKLTKDKRNFSFYINNVIITNSLQQFILLNQDILNNYSAESVLEIAYSFKIEEPNHVNTIKEDEWIRRIVSRNIQVYDKAVQSYCVGLFNSEVSVYNKNFEKVFKIENKTDDEDYCELLHDLMYFNLNNQNLLVTSSRNEDCNLKMYQIDIDKATSKLLYVNSKVKSEYFNSLSLNPVDFSFFAAGDTEGHLQIFKIKEDEGNTVQNKNKKRKTDTQEIKPEQTLEKCHSSEIKTIKWVNNHQVLTSGEDYVINLWNIATKTNYMNFRTNYKTTTSLCTITPDEFLSGQEDGMIKYWDVRTGGRAVSSFAPTAGRVSNYISEICTSAEVDSNMFVSTGYDGLIKMWDLRSTKKPLHEIKTDSEKNFSICFNSSQFLMTGGDNSAINIYSI